MKIIGILLIAVLFITGCRYDELVPMEEIVIDNDLAEGAYCLPYTPQGQVLFDAKWTGVYPEIEHYEGSYSTATFGRGCFWGPAAEFAVLEGVLRTRVGYAGGQMTTPNYEVLGNHIEVFEVDYDPSVISYEDLIHYYFTTYDATVRPFSRRVHSIIYYRDEDEKAIGTRIKRQWEEDLGTGLFTEIAPLDAFYLGEERHQLSYLKQEISIYDEISQIFPEQDQQILSVLASKLNGFIAGYGTEAEFEYVLENSGLSELSINRLNEVVGGTMGREDLN